MVKKSKKIL